MDLVQAALAQAVSVEAHRLGFSLVGITTPDGPHRFGVYERWLAAGRHGEMGYLATERALSCRADPHLILPECESILVLGLPYPASTIQPVKPGHGRVASYAWGLDYHDIIPPRLQALVEFIQAQVGRPIPNRYYTDTGPLLERELAQRAGLGWIGKNTCLINPEQGSYFFLAEILLGLALPADAPFTADRCGSCTRCLDACPTACILPDRTLDARRCISYLTIENKGPIPPELQPALDGWVFGCDICQQVCPWNRFSSPTGEPALNPRPEQAFPDLLAELQLSPEAFRRKFRGTPIKRAKLRGYLRNVSAVVGHAHLADDSRAS
ncbi:MAG: tRNA epoxyqueuosine(34) reductase QueG [Chloroflexota bacterium]